jgi:hypothetical protein
MTGFRLHPQAGRTEYGLSRPLDLGRLLSGIRPEMKRAVVDVESLVQTEAGVQHIAADESSGAVAVCLEHLRDSDDVGNLLAIFFNAVDKRVRGTQQGCMRRKGEGNRTVDPAEQRSALRERVQIWSAEFTVPIAAQMICTQGVDGYEDDGRYAAG